MIRVAGYPYDSSRDKAALQGYLMFEKKRGCQGRPPLTGARGVLASSSILPAAGGKKGKLNSPAASTSSLMLPNWSQTRPGGFTRSSQWHLPFCHQR